MPGVDQREDGADLAMIVDGLEAIIEAAARVLAAGSLRETLQGMADALERIVPYTSLAVYELDPVAAELVPLLAVGTFVEETMAERLSLTNSVAGLAVRRREVVALDLPDLELQGQDISHTPKSEGDEAILVAPLFADGQVVGTLNVWREQADARFEVGEATLLRQFATLAALACQNARQRDQLRDLTLTDELTGLSNRRQFDARMLEACAEAARHDSCAGVVLLDIDDFKAVNDRCGHPAGDEVLRAVATLLRDGSRAGNIVCRIGGEEFAVVVPRGDADAVGRLAERLLERVRAARLGPDGRLTMSAGVAVTDGAEPDPGTLRTIADARLLRAKREGKDRVVRT